MRESFDRWANNGPFSDRPIEDARRSTRPHSPPREHASTSANDGDASASRARDSTPTPDGTESRDQAMATATVIPHKLSREIAKWGCLGISKEETKSIRDSFKLSFEKDSTSIDPPSIDDWMTCQINEADDEKEMKALKLEEKALLAAQYKVMDIAPPLIHLLVKFKSESNPTPTEISAAIKGALMQ